MDKGWGKWHQTFKIWQWAQTYSHKLSNHVVVHIERIFRYGFTLRRISTEFSSCSSNFCRKISEKRRAPYHRTITAAMQRIADTGNVIPNHARAGTSTAVARCVANSFNETSQFSRKLWTSEKNLFETFERQDLKYWQIHFVCSDYIPPCILSSLNCRKSSFQCYFSYQRYHHSTPS